MWLTQEYVGVFKNQGMWRARLFENDAEVYLGHYAEKDEVSRRSPLDMDT